MLLATISAALLTGCHREECEWLETAPPGLLGLWTRTETGGDGARLDFFSIDRDRIREGTLSEIETPFDFERTLPILKASRSSEGIVLICGEADPQVTGTDRFLFKRAGGGTAVEVFRILDPYGEDELLPLGVYEPAWHAEAKARLVDKALRRFEATNR